MVEKEIIKKLELLRGLDKDELELIIDNLTIKKYNKGDVIIGHEDSAEGVFVVLNGKVASTLNLPGNIERNHGEYGTGDFFGEISLFGYKTQFDNYRAIENSELILVTKNDFTLLIEKNPVIATKLISMFLSLTIRHLRNSSKFLADIVQWGESASRRVITDELTGLYNRSFLDDALDSFFHISKSNNKPLSLLMLDIDNFRKINESLGIETGNKILVELVNLIKDKISSHGIIARYGGDEYSVLLPETDLKKATDIAESIRKYVEDHDLSAFLAGSGIPVTISVGISAFPDNATDIAAFKEKADAALYKAKESGRNRVAHVE